jgi:hypothetical protein
MTAQPILLVLVAYDRGAFLGAGLCDRLRSRRASTSVALCRGGVGRAKRGRHGVGAALVDHAAQASFALCIVRLSPGATRAHRLYQRLGWTLVKTGFGTAAFLRIHRQGKDGARRDQAFAAMKIARAKPVR